MSITRFAIDQLCNLAGEPQKIRLGEFRQLESTTAVKKYRNQVFAKVAVAAVAAATFPGFHLAFVTIEIGYLLRQMMQMALAVGLLKNTTVMTRLDLENILALWSGKVSVTEIPMEAIVALKRSVPTNGQALVSSSFREELDNQVFQLIATAAGMLQDGKTTEQVITEIERAIPDRLGLKIGGKKTFVTSVVKTAEKLAAKSAAKLGSKSLAHTAGKSAGKLMSKVMAKITGKIAIKAVGKYAVGFGSVFGGLISAMISIYFVDSIKKSAEEYYDRQIEIERTMDF